MGSWLLRRPPEDARTLLFAFPYAGGGAGTYRAWPATIGDAAVCPVQPPGRENRLYEPAHRSHQAFAADLAEFLKDHVDRPYAFFGHCGGVPFALSTLVALAERGVMLPQQLFASSWGAPHRSLYGPLNFVDLATTDLASEVADMYEKAGISVRDDFVEIAADVLRADLEAHRPWLYDAATRVPCPVTVISWSEDDVVQPDLVHPHWQECADAEHVRIPGEHFAFLDCPDPLRDTILAGLEAPAAR
ncbi:thioesterase domain-containing protein [Streptomyces sp. NPDC012461]|uniref:Thioesterase n=2 Tax=unclassified Streptomyces TaxID=2593676 RepID=A0A6G3R1F3_9ACTN|nr:MULTISPECIES: thioesterase domain-containing protein [unclassified Streptomyces]NEA89425.1 thioesterase [Streptomyces sp. SID14436]NEC81647.1 thioesterase [Streptomyces sp. SID7958]